MYRVVTKSMVIHHKLRKRQIDLGPWQPSEDTAKSWAQYLKTTGLYDSVVVESNGQERVEDVPQEELSF
jgi:hypothetical protein